MVEEINAAARTEHAEASGRVRRGCPRLRLNGMWVSAAMVSPAGVAMKTSVS